MASLYVNVVSKWSNIQFILYCSQYINVSKSNHLKVQFYQFLGIYIPIPNSGPMLLIQVASVTCLFKILERTLCLNLVQALCNCSRHLFTSASLFENALCIFSSSNLLSSFLLLGIFASVSATNPLGTVMEDAFSSFLAVSFLICLEKVPVFPYVLWVFSYNPSLLLSWVS